MKKKTVYTSDGRIITLTIREGTEPPAPGTVRERMPARKVEPLPEMHPIEARERQKQDKRLKEGLAGEQSSDSVADNWKNSSGEELK